MKKGEPHTGSDVAPEVQLVQELAPVPENVFAGHWEHEFASAPL